MPQDKPSVPVNVIDGTGTAAATNNCPGSGKPWESGGKCPVCGVTADSMIEHGITARRGDGNLAPRVPRHPTGYQSMPIPDAPRKPTAPPARPSSVAGQAPSKPLSEPSATQKAEARARRTDVRSSPGHAALKVTVKATANGTKVTDPMTKPFTQTILDYLEWLQAAMGRKFTKAEYDLAGRSITCYGAFQISPERRAARAARR